MLAQCTPLLVDKADVAYVTLKILGSPCASQHEHRQDIHSGFKTYGESPVSTKIKNKTKQTNKQKLKTMASVVVLKRIIG